mmetsp:Transcript_120482/g.384679  ORF Transcript_120482/g.384679 Transcript_120482/m.384679 type:complete len:214 (-) Transcript_120482:213-854(-)
MIRHRLQKHLQPLRIIVWRESRHQTLHCQRGRFIGRAAKWDNRRTQADVFVALRSHVGGGEVIRHCVHHLRHCVHHLKRGVLRPRPPLSLFARGLRHHQRQVLCHHARQYCGNAVEILGHDDWNLGLHAVQGIRPSARLVKHLRNVCQHDDACRLGTLRLRCEHLHARLHLPPTHEQHERRRCPAGAVEPNREFGGLPEADRGAAQPECCLRD